MVYKNVLSLKSMQQDNSIVNSMLKKKMKKNTVTNFDCKRFKNFDHFIKAYVLLTGDNVHIYFHCLYYYFCSLYMFINLHLFCCLEPSYRDYFQQIVSNELFAMITIFHRHKTMHNYFHMIQNSNNAITRIVK